MQLPKNFTEWKYCIEIKCGITLTASFIEQRLATLNNDKDLHTIEFMQLYGNDYKQQVVNWFQQAKEIV